jgi:hypothetical protein
MKQKEEKGLVPINVPQEAQAFNKMALEFVAALDTLPDKKEVKINKYADNSKYLPIQAIENKLNYYFAGLWQTRNYQSKVVVNEMVCSLELGVYHPVLQEWIWRTGVGATQIQLKTEYITDANGNKRKKPVDVLDVGKKIVNTLTKDAPHAKAEAFKNAAKSFGRTFGAALNREFEDEQSPLDNLKDIEDILIELGNIEDYDTLLATFQALPVIQQKDKRIVNLFNQRKNKFKNS